ncbi:hypothetical protein G3I40_05240 [Streptomyces sp. SID14478]|uniref:hypothetical protein n=1 Tax=Streptomyces sp. SID14478 TaxID=2706073 RepID=UPI0013DB9DF4|nr:hypothetical protein [Streptomyces sp. SID14478]NEB74638.1 hypothetical protein [Streptomyces sp. SID14478]
MESFTSEQTTADGLSAWRGASWPEAPAKDCRECLWCAQLFTVEAAVETVTLASPSRRVELPAVWETLVAVAVVSVVVSAVMFGLA